MRKRGPKPKKIIDETWRPGLAYAVGLLATDGCLLNDNLLIDLTSKDREQLENFSKSLGVKFKIGLKWSDHGNQYLRIQFKNRIFYDFLLSIGFTPAKSKTIKKIDIPDKYFFDFLRGCFDGDGCSYSYWDPRWKSSFMFYISFVSASENFVSWIRKEIGKKIHIKGHITTAKKKSIYYQLKYSKYEAIRLAKEMYKDKKSLYLKRKKLKINKSFGIMGLKSI